MISCNFKYYAFLMIVFIASVSCSLLVPTTPNRLLGSSMIANSGLSNSEYASRLQKDGWPVERLNTAATANYLTDKEKNMILAHNLIRHDPVKYAELYVSEYLNYFKGKEFHYPGLNVIMLTNEGIRPVRELYNELKKAKPLPLMYPSRKLTRAAVSHAQYQSRNGEIGHEGQGGMRARIEREGEWEKLIGENIAYGNWSAHDAILGLMIDDGVPGRGHRVNILTEEFRVLGVAHRPHPKFEGGVYVIKYAGGFDDVTQD